MKGKVFQCILIVCAIVLISCNKRPASLRTPTQIERDRQEASERDILVDFAMTLRGSAYRYGGCSPDGFDCSGFTRYVYRKIDVELPPQSSLQAKKGDKVALEEARRGDLIFFGRGRRINHVGLILSNGREGIKVIHSTTSSGVRVDDVSESDYWSERVQFTRAILH